jgi:hypothetical protein
MEFNYSLSSTSPHLVPLFPRQTACRETYVVIAMGAKNLNSSTPAYATQIEDICEDKGILPSSISGCQSFILFIAADTQLTS